MSAMYMNAPLNGQSDKEFDHKNRHGSGNKDSLLTKFKLQSSHGHETGRQHKNHEDSGRKIIIRIKKLEY